MYDSFFRGDNVVLDGTRPEAVLYHRGNTQDFLKWHLEDSSRALRDGIAGVRTLAPHLFKRIAEARALRLAWAYLAEEGGPTPGPDGRRYRDYASAEVWDLCRCLAEALRRGTYRPGPEKLIYIDKNSGRGQRPIVLTNIADRVVQRAAVLILQPVLDPLFDPRSFGYRPKLGHLHALALAEGLTLFQRRRVWLAEDIENAYQRVPVPRLLQILHHLLPADDLLALLETILPGQHLDGLRQGGSLSPLALNVYLNRVLDRPWRRDLPQLPLIRYADDLLVLCRNQKQARQAHDHLRRLLPPAGLPLKHGFDNAVNDLGAGQSVTWLGFQIHKARRGLAVEIAERSWERLRTYLALAHAKNDPSLRAVHTIKHWLNQRGPCYPWSDRDAACERIAKLARKQAFEEIPPASALQDLWQRAYARWCKLRKSVQVGEPQTAQAPEPAANS
jgi:hypothetical protein